MIMGILVIGAVAFWLFKMGGMDTIKGLVGGGGGDSGGGTVQTAGGNQQDEDGNTIIRTDSKGNNFSSVRNINTGSGAGVHGKSIQQQSSNINGVITKNNKVSSFFDVAKVRPRI